jgi:hypothetical protein
MMTAKKGTFELSRSNVFDQMLAAIRIEMDSRATAFNPV